MPHLVPLREQLHDLIYQIGQECLLHSSPSDLCIELSRKPLRELKKVASPRSFIRAHGPSLNCPSSVRVRHDGQIKVLGGVGFVGLLH